MEAKKSAAKEQKEALFAQAKHGALMPHSRQKSMLLQRITSHF